MITFMDVFVATAGFVLGITVPSLTILVGLHIADKLGWFD